MRDDARESQEVRREVVQVRSTDMDDFGNEYEFWTDKTWCKFFNDGLRWDSYLVDLFFAE